MKKITQPTRKDNTRVFTVSETRIRKATRREQASLPAEGKTLVVCYEEPYKPLIINGFEC